MSISYLCQDCAKKLKMKGFNAVNEVGRKHCEGCGDNDDYLIVVDKDKCDRKIDKYNRKFRAI